MLRLSFDWWWDVFIADGPERVDHTRSVLSSLQVINESNGKFELANDNDDDDDDDDDE